MPKWKNILKGVFDEAGDRYHFIVTGSAKLDVKKRSGDSLAGRFFTFHLLPLALREIELKNRGHNIDLAGTNSALSFIESKLDSPAAPRDSLLCLLEFSGFPEPFLKQAKAFHRKWTKDYLDTVIREDIGTRTRIVDREYIFDLYSLLPEHIGSPLSQSSMASHLQISPATVKGYLRRLEDFFLVFSLRPWSKNIKRSLIKAKKNLSLRLVSHQQQRRKI